MIQKEKPLPLFLGQMRLASLQDPSKDLLPINSIKISISYDLVNPSLTYPI
jgi:hypothetical protein